MKSPLRSSRQSSGGFTLVEILVSFTVLGLIMVGVAQMMSSALSATIGGYKHMDADTQARMVLDRMASDISKMSKRTDIDYLFQKNLTTDTTTHGNDQMAFYSESTGYYPGTDPTQQSDTSLVGYMVDNRSTSPTYMQLLRLSKGLNWNGGSSTAMVFNPFPSTVSTTPAGANTLLANWTHITDGADANYQVIGDQVFRMEFTFLTQTSPTSASTTTTISYLYDSPWVTPDTTPVALRDVTAIIVSIAVLDSQSRAALGTTAGSQLFAAASYLQDDKYIGTGGHGVSPSTAPNSSLGALPLYAWKNNLAGTTGWGTHANLGLPKTVGSQVRFYQRYCYLNHLQ